MLFALNSRLVLPSSHRLRYALFAAAASAGLLVLRRPAPCFPSASARAFRLDNETFLYRFRPLVVVVVVVVRSWRFRLPLARRSGLAPHLRAIPVSLPNANAQSPSEAVLPPESLACAAQPADSRIDYASAVSHRHNALNIISALRVRRLSSPVCTFNENLKRMSYAIKDNLVY